MAGMPWMKRADKADKADDLHRPLFYAGLGGAGSGLAMRLVPWTYDFLKNQAYGLDFRYGMRHLRNVGLKQALLEALEGRPYSTPRTFAERLASRFLAFHDRYAYPISNISYHLTGLGRAAMTTSLPLLAAASVLAPRPSLDSPWQTVEDVGRVGLTAAFTVPAARDWLRYVAPQTARQLNRAVLRRISDRMTIPALLGWYGTPALLAGLGFLPRWLQKRTSKE